MSNEGDADDGVDVVVGAGAGGMTAALTAKSLGLDVLMVEKGAHFGGTTGLSSVEEIKFKQNPIVFGARTLPVTWGAE
jgi:phytoene dehydrogenase-like protein